MKHIKKNLFLSIVALTLIISCDNDNDPTNNVCEDAYVSTLITNAFSMNVYSDFINVDYEIHEYEIRINADGEICTIGYQNPGPDTPSVGYAGAYTMEVINNTSGASYSGLHTFSQTMLDYQAITPVSVASGDIITVRRVTDAPSIGGFEATRGRVLQKTDGSLIPYPITQGNVDFLGSTLYYEGGSSISNNLFQPYIALGFKVN
jgi:hypothetical protein